MKRNAGQPKAPNSKPGPTLKAKNDSNFLALPVER
jgi:hypothetical protein